MIMAIGWIEQKRRYWQYKARTEQLPADCHAAIDALERYLEFFGPGNGDSVLSMLEDLADLFEQSERTEPRSVRSSGRTPWSSPRRFFATTRRVSGSAGSGNG
jgi:DNA-binding ferritin-like protein (Dps family)